MLRRYPLEFPVEGEAVGQPVERFVRRCLDADPAHVQKLLRQQRVHFIPAVAPGAPGAEVTLTRGAAIPAEGVLRLLRKAAGGRPAPAANRNIRLRVVHEDPEFVVLDKPAGLPMHPGPRHGTDTLLNGLIARYPECGQLGPECNHGLAHRLDLETSGLLVAARTARAHASLVTQFEGREVEKQYLALAAAGEPGLEGGVIDLPVGEKPAVTEVAVLERRGPVLLLELRPRTGRTHQIRIHLAERGHPVLCDGRYGAGRDALTARLYLKRLALHAERLGFRHPETGAPLLFERPLPRDLRHSWKRARGQE